MKRIQKLKKKIAKAAIEYARLIDAKNAQPVHSKKRVELVHTS